jgi:hypothetical protein
MFIANWWILWLLGLGALNPNGQPAGLPPSPNANPDQAIVAIAYHPTVPQAPHGRLRN